MTAWTAATAPFATPPYPTHLGILAATDCIIQRLNFLALLSQEAINSLHALPHVRVYARIRLQFAFLVLQVATQLAEIPYNMLGILKLLRELKAARPSLIRLLLQLGELAAEGAIVLLHLLLGTGDRVELPLQLLDSLRVGGQCLLLCLQAAFLSAEIDLHGFDLILIMLTLLLKVLRLLLLAFQLVMRVRLVVESLGQDQALCFERLVLGIDIGRIVELRGVKPYRLLGLADGELRSIVNV